MKKILVLFLALLCLSPGYASKLSRYLNKMHAREEAREAKEWQQDMNFADFAFRVERRYTNEGGERCRDYIFRARSNPYRHGSYTVCDER